MIQTLALHELPFDQFQRYGLVAKVLDELAPHGRRLRVLDVGGRTGLLKRFLPNHDVVLMDCEASEIEGLILGDGSALPFVDGAFDVVCAFDTLEHVAPSRRDAFVRECARTASRHVILAGPYSSPRVEAAEAALQAFMGNVLEVEHRYLDEHRELGLPSRQSTERLLEGSGARVRAVGHGRLDRWLMMISIGMYFDHEPLLQRRSAELSEHYNRDLFLGDFGEDVYRHIVVASFGDAPLLPELPEETRARESGDPSPREDLAPLMEFVRGMELLDTARADWVVERMAWIRDRDNWFADRSGLRARIGDLEEDLEGHRQSNLELEREVEQLHSNLLMSMASSKADLSDRDEQIKAHESERAGLLAKIQGLEADLSSLQDRHLESEERAREHGRKLEDQDRRITRLVRELRSRPRNLLRAFALRKFRGERGSSIPS